MKVVRIFALLSLSMSGCIEGRSPRQPSIMEWQGEWGQWSAVGHGRASGASISIFACDAGTLTCRFRYDSESPKSSVCRSSSEDGGLLRISDSRARAQFYDLNGAPSDCFLEIEKIQSTDSRELHLVGRSGSMCPIYCSGEPNFPPVYPFRSPTVYPYSATRDCFTDSRRSRQVWCSEKKVQEFEQQLEGLRLEIERLNHSNEHDRFRAIREDILARCDGSADPKGCLLTSYSGAIAGMQSSVVSAREAHDRDAAAIRTPGDPARGSQLIDRIEGVYKRRFESSTGAGEKRSAENTLEIVRVSRERVFFRVHLEAPNDSICSLSGLARYSLKGVLVYEDPDPPADPADAPCVLQFEESGPELRILDPGHPCTRRHCGIRGGFHGQAFPLSARSPIRNIERLRSSRQYKEALERLK
jgi:hypothetical protein